MKTDWSYGQMTIRERSLIARSLAALIVSGSSYEKAFASIAEQTGSGALRSTLLRMHEELKKSDLVSLLKKQEKLFGSLFRTVIETGESTGTTVLSLLRLADYYDQQAHLKKTVTGKIGNSALITIGTIGALLFAAYFLLDRAEGNAVAETAQQNVITSIALAISTFILSFNGMVFLLLSAILPLLFITGIFMVRLTVLETVIWKIPLFGEWRRKNALQCFFLTLSLLLTGGVALESAIRCASAESRSGSLCRIFALLAASPPVTMNSLADLLESQKLIPYLVGKRLSESMPPTDNADLVKKTGLFYQEAIIQSASAAVIVLGPLLIAITGLLLFSLLAALYMPGIKSIAGH
ncbi:MAG: type II secretion system F family protein [Chitinispirillaceae bacterium]|nr:type II secretion system F family protein [Chitinispirillaceae bacterium]